jgi:outer membrane lipoprotein-sorting protein
MLKRAVGFLALAAAIAMPAAAQSVDEIIAKSLAARGGEAKLRAVKSLRMTGQVEVGPGMEAPMTMEMKRPSLLRMEFTVQGMTGIQAYDGKTGWQVMPFMGKMDPEPMAADDLKNFEDQADFDGTLMDYKAKGSTVEYLGKEKAEGSDAYKLKVTKKNGIVETIFIDAESGLEVKSVTKTIIRGAETEVVSTLTDYREVGGLLFPFAIESSSPGSPQKQRITVQKIELDPQIDDARFPMPAPKPAEAPKPDAKPGESKP